jgi:hypothetical protein
VGLSYFPTSSTTGSRLPGVVYGSLAVAAAYGVLYLLASVYSQAVLQIPAWTVYPMYVYALIGCVAMVVVLPFFALQRGK